MSSILALLLVITAAVHVHGRSINEIMKGDVTTLYTSAEYGYKYAWLELFERDNVVFSVRACSDLHIALLQERQDESFNFTEVVIGGWYNSRSVIRNGVGDKGHYLDAVTKDILHCGEYRSFWISWSTDRLRVGRGPVPSEQTLMTLERTRDITHNIQYVGFCTGYGNTGIWKLEENQGYYLTVFTPDDYKYQYAWKTTDYKNNHFRFLVTACHDAHIQMSPKFGYPVYEVVLGGYNNTRSLLWISGQEWYKTYYDEIGIVSCSEIRPFWVSWRDGLIEVGKGRDVGRDRIMNWTDTAYEGVNYLSVTAGYGSSAMWSFNDDLENVYRHYTHSADHGTGYDFYVNTAMQQHVLFQIQACTDARLALSNVPDSLDDLTHYVYIGTENNTKAGVRDAFSPTPIVEVRVEGLLNCHLEMPFWLSWWDHTARLGRGYHVGMNVIMSWNIANDLVWVNSVGFSNSAAHGGHTVVRRNVGDSMMVHTPTAVDYRRMWLTVSQDVYFRFRVMACSNVQLTLSGIIGRENTETYVVVIGEAGHITSIRESVEGENYLARADTPGILDCGSFRSFWVSWVNGMVALGRGNKYKRNEVLTLTESKPHPVNAIGITTRNIDGWWEFDADRGEYIILTTPYGYNGIKWFSLRSWVTWFYFQVQGTGAQLILASRYHDTANAYHIFIGSEKNTKCTLWKDNTLLQSFTLPNIMDDFELKDFWVGWVGGRIQLGLSKYFRSQVMLDVQDSKPYTVTAVALAGVADGSAEWKLWEYIGSEMTVWSDVPRWFDQLWWSARHRSSIVFALTSCGQAEILLSAIMHSQDNELCYTVTLQDKTNMVGIWRGDKWKKMIERSNPNLLSCSEERFFWLSWQDGHIAVGTGRERGRNTLVAYQDLNPAYVTALAFTSDGQVGAWRLPLSTDDFADIPPKASTGLNAGEIAGIVIGAVAMCALFAAAIFVVLRPPAALQPYLYPSADPSATSSSSQESRTKTSAPSSFDNPLASVNMDFAEVTIS